MVDSFIESCIARVDLLLFGRHLDRWEDDGGVIQNEHDDVRSPRESFHDRQSNVYGSNDAPAVGETLGQRERRGDSRGDRRGLASEAPEQ